MSELLTRFQIIEGHTDSVAALSFSHDGQLLASGGLDGIVNIWDSSTGTLKQKLEGPGEAVEVSGVLAVDTITHNAFSCLYLMVMF